MQTPSWSYERLLHFAPDSRAIEQARRLFFSNKWIRLEGNGQWLWGEYKTAYGDVFNTAVRLDPPLFKCSCKSRRRPCKHSLALILLFLNRPDAWVVKEELPEWLLLEMTAKSKASPNKIQAWQQEKRIILMDNGVADLEKWLLNIIQQGLAQYTDLTSWENMATRMVDAKLGAIARKLRYCQQLFQKEDWLNDVTRELGSLYLFVRAWQEKTTLSNLQKKALLQVAGWNIRKENILKSEPIKDNWLVVGLSIGNEDKLTFRRTWFRGEHTKKLALILDFSYNNRGFEDHWIIGAVLAGQLVYYPGDANFRALFKKHQSSSAPYNFKAGYKNFNQLGDYYSRTLAMSPWLLAFPCLLDDVLVQYDENKASFLLWDIESMGMEMVNNASAWQLLAISGGEQVTVFGEYNGQTFTPLTVIKNGGLIAL